MSSTIVTQIAPKYVYDADPESEGVFAIITVHEDTAPINLQRSLKRVSISECWDDGDHCIDMIEFRAALASVLREDGYMLKGVEITRFGFLGD